MMTDIIKKNFLFEGQIILPLKVVQFCNWLEGSITVFFVCLDPLVNETSKLINLRPELLSLLHLLIGNSRVTSVCNLKLCFSMATYNSGEQQQQQTVPFLFPDPEVSNYHLASKSQ